MPVVEVQFSPKGGAEVKKTAKEIADAIKAQVAATAASGDKTKSIVFTIKQARELQTAFNGDIKKTLDALVKAGIASDDIVLLMKQLNREALEGRRRTLGIAEALTETGGKMKAVKAESDGFNVSLKVARTFAKTFNGDLERTATHLRGAGASTNSIRVAMAALQVEAKGVKTETKTISQEIDEMEGKIRRGVLAAEAIFFIASSNILPSSAMSPTHTMSGLASLIRAAMGPKSRLPKSHSRNKTSCKPFFFAISRAPKLMKWIEGNLLVTIATVLGGLAEAATASNTVVGTVLPGSEPSAHAGKAMSYLESDGIPKVWLTNTLL